MTTTFDFTGKKAVATGAGGAIGGEIARGLANAGAQVAIWDISLDAARAKANEINQDHPDKAIPVECNAIDKPSVEKALAETLEHFSTVDLLLNGAGGSHPSTTTTPDLEFFDIAPEAVQKVMDLNYLSAVIPSQAVGRVFAEKGEGAVVNVPPGFITVTGTHDDYGDVFQSTIQIQADSVTGVPIVASPL